jgi:hypothetical protein
MSHDRSVVLLPANRVPWSRVIAPSFCLYPSGCVIDISWLVLVRAAIGLGVR